MRSLCPNRCPGSSLAARLDTREPADFAAGHIPGALNIPLPELDRRDPRLAEATRILVYAQGYDSPLSPAAAKKLISLGYQNVYDFRGGAELWKAEGNELVQNENE